MYLTYNEYEEMGGTLDETLFDSLCFEASTLINYYTFNRLKKVKPENYPIELKRCIFKLINIMLSKNSLISPFDSQLGDNGTTKTVASESNDGVSVSYNTLSADSLLNNSEKEISKTIEMYLSDVSFNELGHKLLYRGIYPNE